MGKGFPIGGTGSGNEGNDCPWCTRSARAGRVRGRSCRAGVRRRRWPAATSREQKSSSGCWCQVRRCSVWRAPYVGTCPRVVCAGRPAAAEAGIEGEAPCSNGCRRQLDWRCYESTRGSTGVRVCGGADSVRRTRGANFSGREFRKQRVSRRRHDVHDGPADHRSGHDYAERRGEWVHFDRRASAEPGLHAHV